MDPANLLGSGDSNPEKWPQPLEKISPYLTRRADLRKSNYRTCDISPQSNFQHKHTFRNLFFDFLDIPLSGDAGS